MKLSKLLKKVSVAVSVLMIAGMLAACSSPSGGSSSGSGNGAEYTVKYDGIVIGKYDEDMIKSMPEGAGEINGKEVTMTSAYVDGMLAEGKSKNGKDYVAVVFYKGKPVTGLTQAELEEAGSLLTENTDYQISSDNKVIVLTDSGAQKMGVKGKKDNSSSEHSDSTEKEGKIVFTYTNEGLVSDFIIDAKSFDSYVSYYELIKDTDYVMDATGKKCTLTKSGYDKIQAKSKKN